MSQPLKVCMLASTHSPKDARIYRREATALRDAGHRVTIALLTNEEEPPSEVGIKWIHLRKPRNRFMRIVSGFKFLNLNRDFDVYHIHDIELAHLLPLIRLRGKKAIFDVHEFFPEGIRSKRWVPPPLKGIVGLCVALWERFFLSFANEVIVVTSYIGEKFKKHQIVRNFPIVGKSGDINENRKKSIIYVGVMYPERLVEKMIDVAGYVREMGFVVEIYGPVHNLDVEALKQRASRHSNIIFQPEKIPYEIAQKKFSEALFGLCLFDDTPRMNLSFPNKVFEYIAHGAIPIITPINSILDYLEDGREVIVVENGNPEEIGRRIEQIDNLDKLRQNGYRVLEEKFNWDIERKRLIDLYENIK